MPVTNRNIFFSWFLDPLRDLIVDDFKYGKIYIAPQMIHKDPFSIRIWGNSSETSQLMATRWQRQYNALISLYSIKTNPDESYYKQFYADIERIYQILYENGRSKAVAVTEFGTLSRYYWIDGKCDDFAINEFDEGEEGVDGLNVCKFNFNCKIMRED